MSTLPRMKTGSTNLSRPFAPLQLVPGVALATFVASFASLLAKTLPTVGAPVLAIVLGMAGATLSTRRSAIRPGLQFSAKYVLQAAIVLSGFTVSLPVVFATGLSTLPVTCVTMLVAFILAAVLGRMLKLDGALRTLIGIGTAICGASAIAAASTVIEPLEADVALSLVTIFCYNILGILLFPPIGHLMHLSSHAYGIWAGTAINDTSSVVAAGYVYSHAAGVEATIVKLVRATCILPIVVILAILHKQRAVNSTTAIPWTKIIPWFIIGFFAAACVQSGGLLQARYSPSIMVSANFLIAVALAAIGLQTQPRTIVAAGLRPLLFGGLIWIGVAVSSLAVQHLLRI